MAGIFQPQHSESGGGVPVQQPIQPGVTGGGSVNSEIFKNVVKGVLGDGKSGGGGSGDSLFDRKQAMLRPFTQELSKLVQTRKQTGASFRPKLNDLVNQYTTALPMLRGEIEELALSQSGIDVGGVELDPVEAAYQFFQSEMETPKGQLRALKSIVLTPDGNQIDSAATTAKFQQLTMFEKGLDFEVQEMARRVALAEGQDKLENLELNPARREVEVLSLRSEAKDLEEKELLRASQFAKRKEQLNSDLADLKLDPLRNEKEIAQIEADLKSLDQEDLRLRAEHSKLTQSIADDQLGDAEREDKAATLQLNRKRRAVEQGELSVKAAELQADENLIKLIPQQRTSAQQTADGLIASFTQNPLDILGNAEAINTLNEVILQHKNVFEQDALTAGAARSSVYDVNRALQPLLALRDLYTNYNEQIKTVATAIESREKVLLSNIIREFTGLPLGAQKPFIEILSAKVAAGNLDTINRLLSVDKGVWSQRDIFGSAVVLDEEDDLTQGVPSDTFSRRVTDYINTLEPDSLEDTAVGLFDYARNVDVGSLSLESNRKEFVQYTSIAIISARKASEGSILTGETVKTLYNPSFTQRYNEVVSKGDIHADRLERVVGGHFAELIITRKQRVEDQFRSIGQGFLLASGPKGVFARVDANNPNLPEVLRKAVAIAGTNDVEELAKFRFPRNSGVTLHEVRSATRPIVPELRALNETVRSARQYKGIKERTNDFFTQNTIPNVPKTVFVSTEEDLNSAPVGANIIYVNPEGDHIPQGIKKE